MNFRHKLQYFLVKETGISHKNAAKMILEGKINVNKQQVFENVPVTKYDSVEFEGKLLSNSNKYKYVLYHKKVGIECTLNENISNNLRSILPDEIKNLFYTGRLDKSSEGLLLLTNDGNLVNKIISPKAHLPKKYLVTLEKSYDATFIDAMQNGVLINDKTTLPCKVEPINDFTFYITLTQGMNRQIRKMCYTLGNYVVKLKRISIGELQLGELPESAFRYLTENEINYLQKL